MMRATTMPATNTAPMAITITAVLALGAGVTGAWVPVLGAVAGAVAEGVVADVVSGSV